MSESPSGPSVDPSLTTPVLQAAGDSPFALSQEPVTAEGPLEPASPDMVPAPAYEHLGELPTTYGTQSVYLVAYDPHRLFAYWDVDWKGAPTARYALRVCCADGEIEAQADISAADAGRYLDIKRPGGTYYVELGTHARDGSWKLAASSVRVTVPPAGLSGESEPTFATLPFHLSFQRLLELIQSTMGVGENLTAALSRLQQGGEPQVSAVLGSLGTLNGEQRQTLESLLGRHLDLEGGASPTGDQKTSILRDRPEASPAGAFGSENLSSSAFGSERLSSDAFGSEAGMPTVGFGGESLSSGELVRGGSLASGGLGDLSSELLSSGTFGSDAISSFATGPNSEAWRMADRGPGGGSDLPENGHAAMFERVMAGNLDVLGSLFSGFGSPGASDGFRAGGW